MKTFIEMAGEALEPQGGASDRYNREIGKLFEKFYLAGLEKGAELGPDLLETAFEQVKKTGTPIQ